MTRENIRQALADLEPHKPEKQLKVEKSDVDEIVKKLLCVFEDNLERLCNDIPFAEVYKICQGIVPDVKISPQTIREFFEMQLLNLNDITRNRHSIFSRSEEGNFLTALIQKSYEQGNNGFEIDVRLFKAGPPPHKVDCIGYFLKGEEDRKLELTIIGDGGTNWFHDAKNVKASVQGNVGSHFAPSAVNSEFYVSGSALGWFGGIHPKNSVFTAGGSVGMLCGQSAEGCTFEIGGKVDVTFALHAENSVFRFRGKNPYQKDYKISAGHGCKFYGVNKSGEEVLLEET